MRAAALLLFVLAAGSFAPPPGSARGGGGDSFSAPEPSSSDSGSSSSDGGSWGSSSWEPASRDYGSSRGSPAPPRDRRPHILFPSERDPTQNSAGFSAFVVLLFVLVPVLFVVFINVASEKLHHAVAAFLARPLWKGREPVVGVSVTPLIVRDAAFDRSSFLLYAQRVFCTVQSAWSRGAMDAAAPLVSDGVVERFETLLEMQRFEGRINRVSELSVEGTEVVSVLSTDAADRVTVHFTARCRDTYRSPDGRVLSDRREVFEEDWTFLRSASARGLRVPGPADGVCPKCGAPVESGRAALCGHCRTWLNTGEHGWVLCEISQPSVWRLASRTAGWAFDGEADAHPALLEDRAAVFFWWVLGSLARGDASGLQGLATPELFASLAQDARGPNWFGDCGVGEVTLTGSRREGGFAVAVFEILWTGVPRPRGGGAPGPAMRQRSQLALRRREGSSGTFATGLRAAHCAGCGAPSIPAKTSCPHCARPRGEGAGDYVLCEFSTRPWG